MLTGLGDALEVREQRKGDPGPRTGPAHRGPAVLLPDYGLREDLAGWPLRSISETASARPPEALTQRCPSHWPRDKWTQDTKERLIWK